ncbi:Small ubiquitin-related modifier 2 [Acipenser ruthenus]|uniref:Small ubiquitin-related modifier 2 n=1 Tax=Acipenser ruthenus TaxID=7906 RepID=A0A662YYY5_ACIRT|nr:Small ubiquitin-related modifier 2 [Acipenser ruthenus]
MADEKPKDVKTENNDHINLKVAGQDGSVVQFKIKRHTPLSKLMKAYCERQGLSMRQIRFRFDGQPINETDTPAQRTLMLAGGTIHQVGAVNPDNWLCINLALGLTLLYIKEGLSFLYPGGKPMGIFGDGQSVVQKRNPPGGQAIGDGSGERSPGFTIASRICQENNSEEVETVPELKEEAPQPAAAAAAAAPTVAAAGAGAAGPPGRRNPPGGKSSLILG